MPNNLPNPPTRLRVMAVCCWLVCPLFFAGPPQSVAGASPETVEWIIRSSLDNAPQTVLFTPGSSSGPAPLLVHLHSWSARANQPAGLIQECAARGWALLSPDFRGPNNRPEACASPLAIQDVLDAVSHVLSTGDIDPGRIYLLGGSGGGHMALTMAHAAPQLWAAVSAWNPITDLAAWHAFPEIRPQHRRMIEQSCGGPPGSAATDAQYRARSPIHHLSRAGGLPIEIHVGLRDRVVQPSHSLHAFNVLAAANGHSDRAFSAEEIGLIANEAKLPHNLVTEALDDVSRRRTPLFRRTAGPLRITIVDGAHETDFAASFAWFEQHLSPEL